MYCEVCGNKIEDGEQTCSNCGAFAPVKKKKEPRRPEAYMPQQPYQQYGYNGQQYYQNTPGPYYTQYVPPQPKGRKAIPWFVWVIIAVYGVGMILPYVMTIPSVFTIRNSAKTAFANTQARVAYTAMREYAVQQNDNSVFAADTARQAAEHGEIDCESARSEDGVVGAIAEAVCANRKDGTPGYIIVIEDADCVYGYAVQWREKEGDKIIGQFPSSTEWSDIDSGKVSWGEYYESNDDSSYEYGGYDCYDDYDYEENDDYDTVDARPRESAYEKYREV